MRNLLITAALLAALAIGVYEASQAWRLRNEVHQLRSQQAVLTDTIERLERQRDDAKQRLAGASARLSLRLPAPPIQVARPQTESVEHSPATNLFDRFPRLKDNAPNKLSTEQVEPFLKAHGRDAASLLAAYRVTGDNALLAEAMQKHPNDPQVALAAILQKDAPPETRRQWLDTFKQSDPANALPYYLSALNYLQAGQVDQAVPELMAAAGKTRLQDYSALRAQTDAQAYLAAGYSAAEAAAMAPLQQAFDFQTSDEEQVAAAFANFQPQLSTLQQIKALAVNLRELAKSYQTTGDSASADSALQIGQDLGRRFANSSDANGLSQLVGMASEVLNLSGMDPNSPYGPDGQTVQDRITQLRQRRTAIKGLYQEAAPLLGSLSEQEWAAYTDRVRYFGEPAALQWVAGKYGRE